ncbi:MAG: AbrB family transcriptional regulator [Salinisphaeraceae bacterium]|jgi:AbrB family looped-hinge helix DNA binding protein|uniref:AbrB/MazE/SpoVT family DNA-binding domain-containing protein n=1 Tax=Spectribacter acetivorans TaxID=3075603 RepID=A0ABU3BBI5_9GAMM|nr:AbrB/MazE/SpoVT family DNA-binding domain-containing protein [Salinisphaera sp. P385]MAA73229.1 AbrB family transcriptional regulator [Salinisphaeraceae bacterium]MDT0619836.1 AbrB/MazE/SpoVT family DNA-binding domain-containing protein [Salinisphaera sp. P385]
MKCQKVSSKYQVVIPKEVRESMDLKPGQEVQVVELDGIIHLIPVKNLKQMRGFVQGIDPSIEREPDRV